jgi:NTP pyrophosphatase (non-canonical NTP hydrolase)
MRGSEYQNETRRTDLPFYDDVGLRLADEETQRLLHYGMGMVTEAGEFIDALKKRIMYGKAIDKVNLREELGDVLWYVARACSALDVSIESVMDTNIKKLKARFPDKFSNENALTRDLEKEREILER